MVAVLPKALQHRVAAIAVLPIRVAVIRCHGTVVTVVVEAIERPACHTGRNVTEARPMHYHRVVVVTVHWVTSVDRDASLCIACVVGGVCGRPRICRASVEVAAGVLASGTGMNVKPCCDVRNAAPKLPAQADPA